MTSKTTEAKMGMKTKYVAIGLKVSFAFLTLAAIMTQMLDLLSRDLSLYNFFSYFTIESNIFAAVMLLVSATYLYKNNDLSKLDMLRGASTLYMVITGIVYTLLLRNVDVQTSEAWVNTVLHYIMPVIMLLDWILSPPVNSIRFKNALKWTIFPVVYLIYSLIRGSITDWYPYPFINVAKNGYLTVIITSIFILLFSLIIIQALIRSRSGKHKKFHMRISFR